MTGVLAEPVTLAAIVATFLLAGTVKGIIGLGLPTVSLGLLAVLLDLTSAMALLVAPSLVTNLWQAASGGHAVAVLRRTWPFLLCATLGVAIGAPALSHLRLDLLSALLGVLLAGYGLLGLAGVRPSIGPGRQWPAALAFGTANGILTGMTGSFVVPGVMYLQAIGLPRDMLVQAMGILFTLSTAALALALGSNGLWSASLGLLSVLAVVPALIGMSLGQRLRRRLSEQRFRGVFFAAVLLLGIYIMLAAL